jgi:hypothetical protein
MPHLMPYFTFLYQRPVQLWFRGGEAAPVDFQSKTGTMQGIPTSGLLYDLVTLPLLSANAGYPLVEIQAIHDDAYISGPPADVAAVMRIFCRSCQVSL